MPIQAERTGEACGVPERKDGEARVRAGLAILGAAEQCGYLARGMSASVRSVKAWAVCFFPTDKRKSVSINFAAMRL